MMTVTPQLRNLILETSISDIHYIGCIYISHAKKNMYLLCIVVHCASVISLQSPVHTSDGWRYAFTYQWIKVIKPLFTTCVCTHAYMSLCSDTRVFGVVSCMNLHRIVYQNTNTWQTVNCMIRKNGKS